MSNINKVFLLGRLGKDPEVKEINSNFSVANFSLATSTSRKNKNDEWEQDTEWHNITAFDEYMINKIVSLKKSNMLVKGSLVHVEGRIKYRDYKDKEGIDRRMTTIQINKLLCLSSKQERADFNGQQQINNINNNNINSNDNNNFIDDEVPF